MKAKRTSLMVAILILVVGATNGMSHPSVVKGTVNNLMVDNLVSIQKINDSLFSEESSKNIKNATVKDKRSKTEPSSLSAISMARLSAKKNNIAKAIDYYEQAINTEKDKYEKANYCYELALVVYGKSDYPKVRSIAYQAIDLNPKWGKPYILIGKIYAASAKAMGESDLQQRMVYCLAVDQFIKAKAIDPESVAEADKEIAQYSQYFPGKEDAVFENIKAGSSFKIGGWINESTIVRLR